VTKTRFLESIFEVADVWCSGVGAEEYVHFLGGAAVQIETS